MMNILVLGSGGREHAFATKLNQSEICDELFVAPGNAGTASIAQNIAISPENFDSVAKFAIENNIEMIVVGPEAPLVAGVRDYFESNEQLKNIKIVGPGKLGAQLEGSKDFSKEFMEEFDIPTARYKTFTQANIDEALAYIDTMTAPVVLKADGLAAGKGVIIAETLDEAKDSIKEMLLEQKFGEASSKVVIEEFLKGIELSVFVLTDGKDYIILPEAKDYKRIGEQDTGLNTGGMGAVSPVSFAPGEFIDKVENKVVKPTIKGLQARNIDYVGFIFIGLMNVDGEPFVIEYNVRMGDPETQVVLPRITSDFGKLLWDTASKKLGDSEYETDPQIATTVVMVAGGYPESYAKGKEISGLESTSQAEIFHAGTKIQDGNIVTNGGRVLAITGKGENLQEALKNSYDTVNNISWEDVYFRKDIGQDLLKLEK
ncbi:phosphoribosylamine--glycine ligase [Aureibacter tunicatorum]|uniref:Phosphoribosylamine--glycine ligase n=2 Tax=Aureibacter tunicatorum TaxID=866807 RepID=A0AAE4BRR1_9BACT|nr:phosphoribosylamine--glycine ligase [Aureibacter tunicatorum]